jgi:hemerythrin-like domain-containing protein
MSTDAIVLLKQDHNDVRQVFRDFQRAGEDTTRKGRHPEVRTLLPDLETDVLESDEEHHVAEVVIAELVAMQPSDERFDAKTTVLIESVTHHIEEEEQDWFPKVRAGLGRKQLQELGTKMLELRKSAPRSPNQPAAQQSALDAVKA